MLEKTDTEFKRILPMAYALHKMIYDEQGNPCDYTYLEVNHVFEEWMQVSATEVYGKRLTEVLAGKPDRRLDRIATFGNVAKTLKPIAFDEYFEPARKWYRVFAFSSQIDFFTTLFIDISDVIEQKDTQFALLTMLNDIIFELDKDYRFVNVHVSDEAYLFMPKAQFIGKSIMEVFPPQMEAATLEMLQKAKASGTKESMFYPSIMPNDDRWFLATAKHALVRDADSYYISVSDITKIKKLEQKAEERETLFKTIYNQAPVGIALGHNDKYTITGGLDIPSVNPMFEKICGRTKEELANISWPSITHPDDLQADIELFRKFKAGEIPGYEMEKRYLRPDSSPVWVHMVIAPLKLEADVNNVYNHLCIIEDISERKKMEQALKNSEHDKAVLLDNMQGMAYRCAFDRDWTMFYVSAGCMELTGYPPESLLNNAVVSYNDLICPPYREEIWNLWVDAVKNHTKVRKEYEITTANDELKWVLEQGKPLYDENGKVLALEGLIVDITDRKKHELEIKYLYEHDSLSRLHNRRYFEQEMNRLNNVRTLPLSIILVDINGMRLINDAFGYQEGDALIRATSKILKSCSRPQDVLARTGGDEFGILMPNTDNRAAYQQIEAITRACLEYNENNPLKLYEISLSTGYATKMTVEESLSAMTKAADNHLRNRKLLNHSSSHSDIITSIMATMYAKSAETEEHAKRLSEMACAVGSRLGLLQKSLSELELLSMLHDIGKVGIDDSVLKKPDKLTDEEWEIMKTHSEIGFRIAKSSAELESIANYILSLHERWDGSGYPQGLKGEEIPLLSRILAVADAFDAMTNDRVYHKAITPEEALAEIKRCAGTQFDPEIAKVFIHIMHDRSSK